MRGIYFGGFLNLQGCDWLRGALIPLEFLDLLSQIPDRSRAQGKNWQLGPVMLATILAILSGATSYRKVHGFMAIHRTRLNAAFGFGWPAAPAYSAVRTILDGLDGAEVERVTMTGYYLTDQKD